MPADMSANHKGMLVPARYPQIKRIPLVGLKEDVRKDKIMPMDDAKFLLSGRVIVEEKMDGRCSRHEGDRFIIFSEDLLWKHSIHYRVPARFAVIDIFDPQCGRFLPREEKESVFAAIRRGAVKIGNEGSSSFFLVPLITEGKFRIGELFSLIGLSKYAFDPLTKGSTSMEGIVVKQNRSLFAVEFDYAVGKIVKKEFTDGITKHYVRKPPERNLINPNFNGSF